MVAEWTVTLDGITLSCADVVPCPDQTGTVVGFLSQPPEGLGLPSIMTEDVTLLHRDGVQHHSDWYEPRILTFQATICPDPADCDDCPSPAKKRNQLISAWRRRCSDTELVIYPPCWDPDCEGDPTEHGPFGVIGRPRQVLIEHPRGTSGCFDVVLRFDAVDQRMYVLDCCGEPGSGGECVVLEPGVAPEFLTCYPRCYPRCYDQDPGTGEGGGPVTFTVGGTECVCPTITLTGQLTNPQVENVDTGEKVTYDAIIGAGDEPVIIDLCAGTATQGGASRTHLLGGDVTMQLQPGENTLRLISFGQTDTGTAEVCWRPSVVAI